MKKILIFSHAMEIGGAERALLGLLENIDTTKYQVDLFLMRHEGELMKYIPENINLLPQISQYACMAVPFTTVIKRGHLKVAWGRYLGKRIAAKREDELDLPSDNDVALEYSHKYTRNYMPRINNKEYELAISFLTPHYFVAEKVIAKKKIAWIHTDYSTVKVDHESQLKMWSAFDYIASISDNVTNSFVSIFPTLKDRIILLPNIMPMKYMEKLAQELIPEGELVDDGSIKLLSVGRFCTAKNFDNIPAICKRIRELGTNIKWYIIGYGGDEQLIREKIKEAQMQEYVIILGKKENPYPYIRACDLYVQPSRYEGKCVSVIEAQILHKPVVITKYATSESQLADGIDGIIVPMDNRGCAEGISRVLKNQILQKELIGNTKIKDYTNAAMVDKIYQLMETLKS